MSETQILNNNKNELIKKNKKKEKNVYLKIFLIICLLGYFQFERKLNKNIYKQNNNPKISIFLPIYNKANYLKRSISSIQKQTLKNIEIIPVNDGSTDNSLEILNTLAKKDTRIKIINNTKNYGSLFSTAVAILKSKGEYIMGLDPDDEYIGTNTLKNLYNFAKKLNVDFITFFIVYLPDKIKSTQFSRFNKIMKQPELLDSAFNSGNYLIDFYITNKLIKRELLENAIKIFKNEIYGEKWNYHHDNIWSILIYKYANSSVFINKNIYNYYSKNNDSVMFNRGNNLEMKNLIFRNKMYRKIFKDKKEEKYILSGYLELLDILEKNIKLIKGNKETKNICIKDINEFIKKYTFSEQLKKKFKDFIIKLKSNSFVRI